MSQFDVTSVLSQIRTLQSQVAGAARPAADAVAPASGSFMDSLKSAVDAVNQQQLGARKAAEDFELGRTDLASAMLSQQTAQVSFKAMTEVRNKIVRAYQDIMNMPI